MSDFENEDQRLAFAERINEIANKLADYDLQNEGHSLTEQQKLEYRKRRFNAHVADLSPKAWCLTIFSGGGKAVSWSFYASAEDAEASYQKWLDRHPFHTDGHYYRSLRFVVIHQSEYDLG